MSHMKKKIAKCLSALAAVLLMTGVGIPACAAADHVNVGLPVSQIFVDHTTSQAEDTFSYVLTPLKTGAPMPGQSASSYSFTMKGTEDIQLEEIAFTRPGTYRYELKQTVENGKKGYTYAEETYAVEIYVTNAADGGLTASTVVYTETGEKTDRIAFENSYRRDEVPDSTPVPESTSTPESTPAPGSVPKTGDSGDLAFWFALAALSAAGLSGTLAVSRKIRSIR